MHARPHYPTEIQESVMIPTYENGFVLCYYELCNNAILHEVSVKTLAIPTIERNMPILTFILSRFLNVIECSHPLQI